MEVKRSMLVALPAERIFDIVEQAEHYPKFIPWCTGATITERGDDIVAAHITVEYHHVRFNFRTRNPKRRPEWLEVQLVEGPFRRFEGMWRFTPLSPQACKIEFGLRCELSDFFFGKLATPVFNYVTDTLVDAFVKRAERVHAAELQALAQAQLVRAPTGSSPPVSPLVPDSSAEPTRPALPPEVRALSSQVMAAQTMPEQTATPPPEQAAAPAPPPRPDSPEPFSNGDTTMNQPDQNTLDALRGTKLAIELDEAQCVVLSRLVTLRNLKDGEVLVREGVPDNHLYVVVKGTLGVVKNAGTHDQVLLHSLGAGELAGELGFLDGTERFASLVALGDVQVINLEREKLETLIETDPHVLYRVMRSIIRTVHLVQRRLSMQATELSNYIFKQHGRY